MSLKKKILKIFPPLDNFFETLHGGYFFASI